ncbi:hypothetical protein SHKM778_45120 [Streptomyces sp. KM77-8]|uniref:Transposase n=1 Tax=Streptomyces haneummycinicus TaxID=3074435 RepID=A0AAT9HL85_9ACTN
MAPTAAGRTPARIGSRPALSEQVGQLCPDGVHRLLRLSDWDEKAVRDGIRDFDVQSAYSPCATSTSAPGVGGPWRMYTPQGAPLQRSLPAQCEAQGRKGSSYALSRKNFSSPPPLALYWQFTVPPGPVASVTPLPVTMRRKMFVKVADSRENEPSGWARARNFS